MKVNIVMLVKDRDRLTNQCLDSLAKNTPLDLYNLTIVDDCSKTPLEDWYAFRGSTERIGWKPMPVTVVRVGSGSITGRARNLGIYWAEKYWGRGDYLYLTDNDVYFTPGWLEKMVSTFEPVNKEYAFVLGGWNHPFLQPNGEVPWEKYGMPKVHTHDAVAGASQLMRWKTWDKYGPLDAHAVGVGQSEDWKFCQDIIKGGGRVGSIYPRVVFNCGVTNSFGQPSPGADVMIAELKEAKKQYPDLYWE